MIRYTNAALFIVNLRNKRVKGGARNCLPDSPVLDSVLRLMPRSRQAHAIIGSSSAWISKFLDILL